MSSPSRYTVQWSAAASSDLEDILDYIAADSPTIARTVLTRLRDAAAALQSMPERGRVIPELDRQGVSMYRELVVAPWRILYRVATDTVYVVAVVDGRRNVEDILLRRLTRGDR